MARLGKALDSPESEWIARELQVALFRHAGEIAESDNRSELMRTTIELLVDVAEKVEEDLRFAEAYAEAARARTDDDEEFLDASQRAAAALWREQ